MVRALLLFFSIAAFAASANGGDVLFGARITEEFP